MMIGYSMSVLSTINNFNKNIKRSSKSAEKLSSGLRLKKASDDAAGLAISEEMKTQIRGLNQASRNAQDGISLLQTAEGALNETHSILQKIRELAVEASNGTNTSEDRESIEEEVSQSIKEIDNIRNSTNFNTRNLIDGSAKEISTNNWYDAWQIEHITNGFVDSTNGNAINENTLLTNIKELPNTNIFANNPNSTITLKYNCSAVGHEKTLNINCNNTTTVQDVINSLSDENINVRVQEAYTRLGSFVFTMPLEVDESPDSYWSISVTDTASGNLLEPANTCFFNNGNFGATKTIPNKSEPIVLQIGANENETLTIGINDMGSKALGVSNLKVNTQSDSNLSIKVLDNAIEKVSFERGKIGSYENRLEHTMGYLGVSSENLVNSESKISDADMAKEMMNYIRSNVEAQASQMILSQTRQQSQSIIKLLEV